MMSMPEEMVARSLKLAGATGAHLCLSPPTTYDPCWVYCSSTT